MFTSIMNRKGRSLMAAGASLGTHIGGIISMFSRRPLDRRWRLLLVIAGAAASSALAVLFSTDCVLSTLVRL